ncbi:hypothetical protein [Rhodococcoides fascians]|uniref:hypothetical protein n=1 Tax=Rhodococcoides fascians TaxID=1828 RepID=UPI000563FB47|nr:hypothetical protein [Rhodococcus fascians]
MIDLDLDAIEARANAATPGHWETIRRETQYGYVYNVAAPGEASGSALNFIDMVSTNSASYDAELIAHAREDIPAMAARIRELEAKNTTLGMERVRLHDAIDRVGQYAHYLADSGYDAGVQDIGERIIELITTNPLPSEQDPT